MVPRCGVVKIWILKSSVSVRFPILKYLCLFGCGVWLWYMSHAFWCSYGCPETRTASTVAAGCKCNSRSVAWFALKTEQRGWRNRENLQPSITNNGKPNQEYLLTQVIPLYLAFKGLYSSRNQSFFEKKSCLTVKKKDCWLQFLASVHCLHNPSLSRPLF